MLPLNAMQLPLPPVDNPSPEVLRYQALKADLIMRLFELPAIAAVNDNGWVQIGKNRIIQGFVALDYAVLAPPDEQVIS
jgi:hypothetical protein